MNPSTPNLQSETTRSKQERWIGITFIQTAGMALKLLQSTICCAAIYFHEFYNHFRFEEHDKYLIGSACLFLASKSEENTRRLRDVINVMQKIRFPEREPLNIMSDQYHKFKVIISEHEQMLLRALMFHTTVSHPYKYLMNYAKFLGDILQENEDSMRGIVQMAWTILNDMMPSVLYITHKPNELACGALYVASLLLDLPLKTDEKAQQKWYEEFGVSLETLEKIGKDIADVYEKPLIMPEVMER
uniref:Cyclin-like domain-containing protein n=1 Tax=Percolomonas cosmopolitus TaxID=63605 RepID=A0A7S1KNJ0_9EUKA|mmetsp:Transcript_2983/g.11425  ORF Transcript_2983/g.11425 Transcript_2983/m.11425 type:complete len:245 (+) Transcript_2983:132-866(+)|eukprot:CAMPEP_0117440030 /NCGR_PEP_ID=MMETSP0759-20121206/2866_1 /TAXON_ID=63605 /ORGANISM="Percolomonas cosmopolitus, Strain WS" /LENGTH=244 /DNA_ID=CAMNT_0005231755 /DNA_START=111 /DNA_END=845 /DNA_ORIENTATION=+